VVSALALKSLRDKAFDALSDVWRAVHSGTHPLCSARCGAAPDPVDRPALRCGCATFQPLFLCRDRCYKSLSVVRAVHSSVMFNSLSTFK